jgi:hypothetical protein
LLFIILACCHVASTSVWAADVNTPAADETSQTQAPTREDDRDRRHRFLSGYIMRASDKVDDFFHDMFRDKEHEPAPMVERFYGDRQLRHVTSSSYIEITPSVTLIDGESADFDVDFSAKLRLRRISSRLQLFVDSFQDDEDLFTELSVRKARREELNTDKGGGVGLRYMLSESMKFRSSVAAGLAFKPEPVPKFRIQGRWSKKLNPWTVRLTERGFWRSDDGFGEKTQLDFLRPIGDQNDFKASTEAIWSETSEGVDLGQVFSFSHVISRKKVVAVRVGAAAHTEPSTIMDQYFIRFPYRQRIHSNWMFLELEPGVIFPNDRDFKATPLVILRVDMLFGGIPP